jgi:hypothetical protein
MTIKSDMAFEADHARLWEDFSSAVERLRIGQASLSRKLVRVLKNQATILKHLEATKLEGAFSKPEPK